jgi:hypothetical protein
MLMSNKELLTTQIITDSLIGLKRIILLIYVHETELEHNIYATRMVWSTLKFQRCSTHHITITDFNSASMVSMQRWYLRLML